MSVNVMNCSKLQFVIIICLTVVVVVVGAENDRDNKNNAFLDIDDTLDHNIIFLCPTSRWNKLRLLHERMSQSEEGGEGCQTSKNISILLLSSPWWSSPSHAKKECGKARSNTLEIDASSTSKIKQR